MNNLCADIGYNSLNKFGEELCGDHIEVVEQGDLILIRVSGSHFLWKQVRRLVGLMVEAGRGKLQVKEIEGFFKRPSEIIARLTAPPSGLYLEKVCYEGDSLPVGFQPTVRVD